MKKNQVRISGRKSTWSSAMLSLITVFAMIPAEVGVGTVGWSWRMGSMWSRMRSNTGSRARLRTFAETLDGII